MQVFLIEEEKSASFFKKYFKRIGVVNDKILINCNIENLKVSTKIKLFRKIKNILDSNNIKNVIISKEIKKDSEFVNLFYSNNLNIIDGRILFKKLIIQIIENICTHNNLKSQEKQISILINSVNVFGINCVKELSQRFKSLNVVTNNINYFKPLKEKLWEEDGIIITLTNNKKKALSKANIILNIDFPEELVNKYTIFEEAILVNLEEEVKIRKKRFNGKIISNYKIKAEPNSKLAEFLNRNEYKNFETNDLTEVYIANNPKALYGKSKEEIQNIIIL